MWEHVWEHEANFSALFFAREENRVLDSCARRAARRAGAGWLSNLNHGQDTRLVHAWTSGLRDSSGRAPSPSNVPGFRSRLEQLRLTIVSHR